MAQRNSSGRGATATATKRRASSGTAVDESKIKSMRVEDLRGQLRKRGISGISALRKPDLVNRLVRLLRAESRGGTTTTTRKAAAKAPAKKAPARKTAAKKTATPGRRATTAKKAPAKKAPAKKATARKTAAKRAPARKAPAKTAAARKTTVAARQPTRKTTTAPARRATGAATRPAGTRKAAPATTAKAPGTRKATTAAARKKAAEPRKTTSTAARKTTNGAGRRSAAAGRTRQANGRSKTLAYAQPISSTQDQPERPGRSLVTRNHDVIRRWAEARNAQPATIEGTERDGRLGVLTFDFPGWREGGGLKPVSWDEWFETFDLRDLNFIYQEQLSDGRQSNFFRTEVPQREDG